MSLCVCSKRRTGKPITGEAISMHRKGIIAGVITAALCMMLYHADHCTAANDSAVIADAVACNVSVYAIDPDPKGINVRAAPNKNAAVLQIIPMIRTEPLWNSPLQTETGYSFVLRKECPQILRCRGKAGFMLHSSRYAPVPPRGKRPASSAGLIQGVLS